MKSMHDRLRAHRGKLNAASAELNEYIVVLNACLKSFSLGVEAWVPLSEAVAFGYARVDRNWQLCVSESDGTTPLINAKRRLMAASISHFENLLIELERQCELVTAEIVEASILASQLAEGVRIGMAEQSEVRRG